MTSIVGPLLLKMVSQLMEVILSTLRHGLGWGFIWVLPQGHVKVKSAQKGQNI